MSEKRKTNKNLNKIYLSRLGNELNKGLMSNCQYKLNKNLEFHYVSDLKDGSIINHGRIDLNNNFTSSYMESLMGYCEATGKILEGEKYKTLNRLVIGLGDQHVKETSLTLHHIYGIPYVPGQAFKGNVRHCYLDLFYDSFNKEFKEVEGYSKEQLSVIYKHVFGDSLADDEKEKGHVLFFDAYPINRVTIEKDVMTPHIKHYYEKGNIPDNKFKAEPIFFYTVSNTEFNFAWAIDTHLNEQMAEIGIAVIKEIVNKVIKTTLEEYGIGAKTSVNYGYFYDTE